MLALTAILFQGDSLTIGWFMLLIGITFFIASAGASSAYLTVSEIFPMETRALAIAFFYAVGTAIGGITGPLLFGHLIASGSSGQVAVGFFVGAAAMAIGGIAELAFGVSAEQKPLEQIAQPLTAQEAEGDGERARPRRARSAYVSSPGMWAAMPAPPVPMDREVEAIVTALRQHGPIERAALARAVGARYWGPGRFRGALVEALVQQRIRRVGRARFDVAAH
jgi:MFS family permease